MFIQKCWYVAAWSHEIDQDKPFSRTICGKKVVFWRSNDGHINVFDDRCCHRGAPLSAGRKEGDSIRCMYHGFRYGIDGVCVEIPGQERIPKKACVKRYAAVEKARWVWVWLGDASTADEALIPDTHWLDDPDWSCTPPGYLHYDVNYELINDNLLDFSHLSYVHPTTLGGSEEYAQLRSSVTAIARGLHIDRWFLDRPAAPFVEKLLISRGMRGNVDRWNVYDFVLPGVLIMSSGFAPAGRGAKEGNRDGAIEFRHCQAVTPEGPNTSHYFFCQPRNFDQDKPEVSDALHKSILTAFEEDRVIIEAQANNISLDPTFSPIPCVLDSALSQFRRLVRMQLHLELEQGRISRMPDNHDSDERAAISKISESARAFETPS